MKKTALFLLIITLTVFTIDSYSQLPEKMDSTLRAKGAEMPAWTVNFNLLDVAFYGPIIQLEFRVSNRSYVTPWVRYSYAGVISQYQWTNFESYNKYDPASFGIAVGYKTFLPGDVNRQTIYYGGFGEFISEKGLQNTDEPNEEFEQTRMSVAIYGNLGYRWKSQKNFYISLGILPGFAYDLKNESIYTRSQGPYNGPNLISDNRYRFIGMIDMSFGWNFEN
jgi:hypothetical protein